ncbi:MAG: 50S ribosomal protein L22 [Parvularculaceae bacterium]
MAQKKNARRVSETEAMAKGKNIKTSPQKLNLVAQLIRGKKVEQALAELTFSRKRVARQVKDVLESAIANAENNHDLDIDTLVVDRAFVGKNMVLKRWTPRGRGKVGSIKKPFSEITIVVKQVEEAA